MRQEVWQPDEDLSQSSSNLRNAVRCFNVLYILSGESFLNITMRISSLKNGFLRCFSDLSILGQYLCEGLAWVILYPDTPGAHNQLFITKKVNFQPPS